MDYDVEMIDNQWVLHFRTGEPFPGNESHDGDIISPSRLNWCPWEKFDGHIDYYFSREFGVAT